MESNLATAEAAISTLTEQLNATLSRAESSDATATSAQLSAAAAKQDAQQAHASAARYKKSAHHYIALWAKESKQCKAMTEEKAQLLQQVDQLKPENAQLKQENTELLQHVDVLKQLLDQLLLMAWRQQELITPVVTPVVTPEGGQAALCVQEVSSQQVSGG